MRPIRTPMLWIYPRFSSWRDAADNPTRRRPAACCSVFLTAWPPSRTNPDRRLALDLVETALKRLDIGGDTSFVDEAGSTTALLGNDFDGKRRCVARRGSRALPPLFEPYLENRLILVGRRGSGRLGDRPHRPQGKDRWIVGGYSYGDAVQATTGPTWVGSTAKRTASGGS